MGAHDLPGSGIGDQRPAEVEAIDTQQGLLAWGARSLVEQEKRRCSLGARDDVQLVIEVDEVRKRRVKSFCRWVTITSSEPSSSVECSRVLQCITRDITRVPVDPGSTPASKRSADPSTSIAKWPVTVWSAPADAKSATPKTSTERNGRRELRRGNAWLPAGGRGATVVRS